MRKKILVSAIVVVMILILVVSPAGAITFGELDGDRHPNVGALVVFNEEMGVFRSICSGTLVSETVFLTAAHCVMDLPASGVDPDEVWVTFDPVFEQSSILYPATYYSYPGSWHDMSDPKDLAVLVLDEPINNITPALLPPEGLLDQLKDAGSLKDQKFVAVGYGRVRDDKTGGFHNLYRDPKRRFVEQTFLALTQSWLKISMNPSTGDGGTCYGDSGGPHFLGDTSMVMAVTVTGDAPCRATDVDYRLDTPVARAFLGQFLDLP